MTARPPGDGPASSTTVTSTPYPTSCAGKASASGPLPAKTTRLPGETRCVLTRVWAPPAVITPGSVHPGKATGRSWAPGARITCRALTVVDSRSSSTRTSDVPRIETTAVRSSTVAPLRSTASISARPRTKSLPSAAASVTRNPGPGCLKIWPPSVGRSSTSATASPELAAWLAAARPAGPPPTTATSYEEAMLTSGGARSRRQSVAAGGGRRPRRSVESLAGRHLRQWSTDGGLVGLAHRAALLDRADVLAEVLHEREVPLLDCVGAVLDV